MSFGKSMGEPFSFFGLRGLRTSRWVRLLSIFPALLCGACWALGAGASGGSSWLGPRATVLLLNGLPGDLESETTYREQLQAWIEVCARAKVSRVIVLCDAPETVTLPGNIPGKVFKADQTNFLQIAETLSTQTNDLVVIAWGHGGRQGTRPVFHVRGPRLTPADFKLLAEKVPTESRWILSFRGSGAFATQLGASQRQILSSEADTTFNSDPVSMGLLLKIAGGNGERSFTKVAEDLGQAIGAWYSQRHLARTEEPTLWTDSAKPQLLVRDSVETSEPVANSEKAGVPGPVTPSETTDLPAAWKSIRRVEPGKYSGHDGIVLQKVISYTLAGTPAITAEQDEFIQILTSAGKRFGDLDLSYAPPFEEVYFLDCEVLKPDGRLTRLDPDNIREEQPESLGDYQGARRKFISLPGMVPGAVLHLRYRREWKTFPLPHISLTIPLSQPVPILHTLVQVSIPRNAPFHFALEELAATDPAVKQSNYGTSYSWAFDDLPARQQEILARPDKGGRLLISTFPDWPDFAQWYGRICQASDEVTPDIAAKALELTKDAPSQRDKVMALYKYVATLRYVAIPMGVNSFRPHAAANVLANQYGDCKDKANLFNALLQALKIHSHLVLLPRFSQAHEAAPGLAFNHAISQVMLDSGPIWVDTTDEVCPFGLLPPGDPGRKVLVIDGASTSLTQLPFPEPKDHRLELKGQINAARPAEPLPVELSITAHGYPDYQFRAAAHEAEEHKASLPLVEANLAPAAGALALGEQTSSDVSALDQDFSWRGNGTWVGAGSTSTGSKWLLHSPLWMPKEWAMALHRRKGPLFLDEGYPITLTEKFLISLPANAQIEVCPGPQQSDRGPLRWKMEWATVGHDKISANLEAELAQGELSLGDTTTFQQQLRELLAALARDAVISLPPELSHK